MAEFGELLAELRLDSKMTQKLIDKIPTLKALARSKRINYIISACKYTAYNFVKSRKMHAELPFEDYIDLPDPQYNQHEIELRIIKEEELEGLTLIWEKLDLHSQCLLEGYYILEKPMSELAKDLGITTPSVRMALSRSRKKALGLLSEKMNVETVEGAL